MLTTTTTALLTLPLLTTAHFTLRFPTQRGAADTESSEIAPCGGLPVSSTRTSVSLTSFPLALEMGHDESVVQVLLSLSSNPESEDAFNVTLERTFGQTGLGDFCLPDVMVPEGVKEGDIGTVQVVTDGEGGGGLYAVCISLVSFFLSWESSSTGPFNDDIVNDLLTNCSAQMSSSRPPTQQHPRPARTARESRRAPCRRTSMPTSLRPRDSRRAVVVMLRAVARPARVRRPRVGRGMRRQRWRGRVWRGGECLGWVFWVVLRCYEQQ